MTEQEMRAKALELAVITSKDHFSQVTDIYEEAERHLAYIKTGQVPINR